MQRTCRGLLIPFEGAKVKIRNVLKALILTEKDCLRVDISNLNKGSYTREACYQYSVFL